MNRLSSPFREESHRSHDGFQAILFLNPVHKTFGGRLNFSLCKPNLVQPAKLITKTVDLKLP